MPETRKAVLKKAGKLKKVSKNDNENEEMPYE